MTILRSLSLALAATFLTVLVSAGPALAGDVRPADACARAPEALRALAENASADARRLALRDVKTGEALCEARNRLEAVRKFEAAARALGTDLATALSATPRTAALN
ncbi:MAG: hypothetical protein NZM40_01630 [Sphingomonadaceae bacterium]|uniref:hypothetical protein n=1 Tax=Thermaurantiacus sp. TaxID=2820283 RepID=UPI00298EFC90|nr:hypothetical protein [Thermaurantiacus sp.]MCS6986140.1 hypothetical protein [Sphingomonadaceae bacterium]MDW8414634.1 hypothetical protein [Thermaurantiacus sp.]